MRDAVLRAKALTTDYNFRGIGELRLRVVAVHWAPDAWRALSRRQHPVPVCVEVARCRRFHVSPVSKNNCLEFSMRAILYSVLLLAATCLVIADAHAQSGGR